MTLLSEPMDTAVLHNRSEYRRELSFAAGLWPLIDFSGLRLSIKYSAAALRSGVSYRHPFKKVALNDRKSVVVEKQTVCSKISLAGPAIEMFGRLIADRNNRHPHEGDDFSVLENVHDLLPFEIVTPGLARYY